MKPASKVATTLFAIIAGLHLVRLMAGMKVMIGEVEVPPWVSVFGILISGGLALWLWREQHP